MEKIVLYTTVMSASEVVEYRDFILSVSLLTNVQHYFEVEEQNGSYSVTISIDAIDESDSYYDRLTTVVEATIEYRIKMQDGSYEPSHPMTVYIA